SWRVAMQFDLGDIPSGANVTDARLRIYHQNCLTVSGGSTCSTAHQVDAHRITTSWTSASTTEQVTFDPTVAATFTLPANATNPQWMGWNVTTLVNDWRAGRAPNFGLLLQRRSET